MGFGSYNLISGSKISFSQATIYRINNLAFQFIFYPALHVSFVKDPSSQSALIGNL